jgi:hypothetical protein
MWNLRMAVREPLARAVTRGYLYAALKLRRGALKEEDVMLSGLVSYVVVFVAFWAVVWAGLWWIAPTLLVGSSSGLGTMLQVVPATIVAIFVLVLGSAFVVVQQAITGYGNRAALMMIDDSGLRQLVIRPLLIAILALLLAGQVPDHGSPAPAVSAAVTVAALATATAIVTSAGMLPALLTRFTAPVNFTRLVIEGGEGWLRAGFTSLVVFRVGLLAEMLRSSVRRGDGTSIHAAVVGLGRLQEAYIAAAEENPAARVHTYDNGEPVEGWLGEPLAAGYVRAAEEGMIANLAEDDGDTIGLALQASAVDAVRASHYQEAEALITGLTKLGVSAYQVLGSGVTNVYVKSPEGLVAAEAVAEEMAAPELAARALAGWALVAAYAQTHFGMAMHPLWGRHVERLGPSPPWEAAAQLVMTEDFLTSWGTKMDVGPDPVLANLGIGAYFHEHGELPPEVVAAMEEEEAADE